MTPSIALVVPAVAALLPVAGAPAPGAGQEVRVPGLASYSLQRLDVPPPRPGEPAVLLVDVDGRPYVLDLHPHSLRSPDFRLLEVREGAVVEHPAPPVSTYRGDVYGPGGERVPGARALASEDDDGWTVAIDLPGRVRVLVQPVSDLVEGAPAGPLHVVFDADAVQLDGSHVCGTDMAELRFLPEPGGTEPDDPPTAAAVTGNQITEIAFDTDVEYAVLNGLDVVATMRDVERVMNAVEALYEDEVDITYEITSIVVRTGPTGSDPYSTTDPSMLLDQLQLTWSGGFPSVRRDVVHLMTGRALDGGVIGVAFLSGICSSGFGYGLSQTLFASAVNNRAALTAHELGHNWSAQHCNGNGDCHVMCSALGGCDGIGNPITFGLPTRSSITSFRSSRPCLTAEPAYLAAPFFEDWPQDMTVDPDKWVFNDGANTRDLASNEPTPSYSVLLNSTGTAEGEQDDLRTHFIDLSQESGLFFSFFTQHSGVEAGEDLVVEFRNSGNLSWNEWLRIPSDGIDQTQFEFHRIALQPNLYHDRFRFRFRVESDETNDRWFVDNVMIHDGPNLAQQPLVRGSVVQQDAYGTAPGDNVIYFISLTGGGALGSGAGPSFFGGQVVLDVVAPLLNLGIAVADANGVAHKPIFIPFAVAPGTAVWTQAVRLDPVLANSTTSNVVAQTVQ